ncbi:MAG TPA: ABC transporter permease, partial [Dietzia timorensis]
TGAFDHYFHLFLPPQDVLYSFVKVLIFAFALVMIHCFYGYTASGGPAGVGVAVGRAVRTAIVVVTILNFFIGLAIWGTSTSVRIAG